MKEFDLSGEVLDMHRDHFLFQIYSRLSYKDLKQLKKTVKKLRVVEGELLEGIVSVKFDHIELSFSRM